MVNRVYYLDHDNRNYKPINARQLCRIESEDNAEYLYIKENLVRFPTDSPRIEMVFYRNVMRPHFRRKGCGRGNRNIAAWRGEAESLTHYCNVRALSRQNCITIVFKSTRVRVYFEENPRTEYRVVCNNRTYISDLYISIKKTEPVEYAEQWNYRLFMEIFHECRVDSRQAEDFYIENLPLFEHKIMKKLFFVNDSSCTTEEDEENIIDQLAQLYQEEEIVGNMICPINRVELSGWHRSEKRNLTCNQDDVIITAFSDKEHEGRYVLALKNNKQTRYVRNYNNQGIESEEQAIRLANYLFFRLYNNERINQILDALE